MVYRFKHSSTKQHFLGLLQGFAGILDSAVIILSLGFLASNFEMKMAATKARLFIAEKKKGKK